MRGRGEDGEVIEEGREVTMMSEGVEEEGGGDDEREVIDGDQD